MCNRADSCLHDNDKIRARFFTLDGAIRLEQLNRPQWSPAGRILFFAQYQEGNTNLWLLQLDK